MSRRSEVSNKTKNNIDFNLSLFEHALKDPASKNLILQLLSSNQKNVFELFKPAGSPLNTPVKRVKQKEHCESPTALLRRRELEKKNRPESAQSHTSEHSSSSGRSSTISFERILKGVVAYVEINSNGNDRSGGAKSLLKSMGAIVSEKFTRDVTHVIFKDGLYTTYQRAKLLKVHLVSVLWLEATRRNGVRVQEKNYPALGTKNYDLNVSLICSQMQKDYEDVIRDEIRRTLESGSSLPSTKSLLESRRKTVGSSSKSFDTSSQLVSQSFKNNEVDNILSKIRGQCTPKKSKPSSMILQDNSPASSTDEDLSRISQKVQSNLVDCASDPFRPSSLFLNEDSDSTSECGMINGDFSQKDSVVNNALHGILPLQSDEVFTSTMDITCPDDSHSKLLTSNMNKTSNSTTNMEITPTARGSILQNLKGSLLNSFSHLTLRNHSMDSSLKRSDGEKENFFTPPKTQKLKSAGLKSTVKGKNVGIDVFSTPTIDNEIAMSENDFYNLKTPKYAVSKRKLLKPINILSQRNFEEKGENVLNEKVQDGTGTVGTILNTRDNITGQPINTSNTTDNSCLHYSSETNQKSTSTSMSSLRLSKSSQDNSTARKSSGNHYIENIVVDMEHNATQEQNENRTHTEPLLPTFVTKRKKTNKRSTISIDPTNQENSCIDKLMDTEISARTTRAFKRVSSVVHTEEEITVDEFENRRTSHDKNMEVKLTTPRDRKATTPRAARKSTVKIPTKSDVLDSPFVNTRPRRKSLRAAKETKVDCSMKPIVDSPAGFRRTSSRRNSVKSAGTPKKIIHQECIPDKIVLPVSHNGKESEEGKSVFERNLYSILEEEKSSDLNNLMNKSVQPEVILQDVLSIPGAENQSIRKTRRKTISQQDKCVVSAVSISDEKNDGASPEKTMCGNDLSTDKKLRTFSRSRSVVEEVVSDSDNNKNDKAKTEIESRRTQRMLSNNKRKVEDCESNIRSRVSRSKSESDIPDTNTRRGKRIRKLYDPTQVEPEEKIQENLGVNDQEERKTIRQEKVWKVNVVSQTSWLNGNVLMSQKAMDFLEKVKTNQDNMTMMFKKPESVLEELGIDRGKKDVKRKDSIMNNSADEQVDLAEEFVNKRKKKCISQENGATQKTPRTRRTMRNLTQKALTTGNSKRRSTMEFVPKPLNMPKVRTKLNLDQKPTIVCTKMHKADVQMFIQIVKKLGRFEIEDEVSARTTHLVVGEPKRTVNMLRALSRGCWILKHEWLLLSLEEGRWLPEEKFEATEFSPAVQRCRLRRQAFGPSYSMNIFLDCGMIYVAKSTMPRCSDLRELITLCEGQVTKISDNAKIVVGAYYEECDCVNEFWVLDSISSGKLKPLEDYSITPDVAKTKSPFV